MYTFLVALIFSFKSVISSEAMFWESRDLPCYFFPTFMHGLIHPTFGVVPYGGFWRYGEEGEDADVGSCMCIWKSGTNCENPRGKGGGAAARLEPFFFVNTGQWCTAEKGLKGIERKRRTGNLMVVGTWE